MLWDLSNSGDSDALLRIPQTHFRLERTAGADPCHFVHAIKLFDPLVDRGQMLLCQKQTDNAPTPRLATVFDWG